MKRFGLFLLAVMLLMACTDKKGEFVRPNDRSAQHLQLCRYSY